MPVKMNHRFVSHKVNLYSPDLLFSINCLSINQDKTRLAILRRSLPQDKSSSSDETNKSVSHSLIEIWDYNLDTRLSLTQTIYEDEDEPCLLESLDWSHDGRLFACGLNGRLHHVNLVHSNLNKWYPLVSGAGWCLNFNEARTLVAIGTEEGYICVFNVTAEDGKTVEFEKTFNRDQARILCLCWYESDLNGKKIISGSLGSIKIWDYEKGICLKSIKPSSETVNIWSLIVLDSFIIVSGDSKGNTSFWDGNSATLINAVPSHKADALCLTKSSGKKQTIYSSGIDPNVVTFNIDSSGKGIQSSILHLHSQDVRSLVYNKDWLISGGFDCYLTRVSACPPRQIRQAPYLNHFIHVHRDKILFQYYKSLELWEVGSTCSSSIQLTGEGCELPLTQQPSKLAEICTKRMIHRSGFTDSWIAYSILEKLKVLHYANNSLTKIPLLCDPFLDVITDVQFVDNNYLLITTGATLNIFKLATSGIVLEKSLSYKNKVHRICCSSEFVAISFANLSITVLKANGWSVYTRFKVNNLPTCLKLNPYQADSLWIGFANHQLLEYSVEKNEFTKYCYNDPNPYLPLEGITFHPTGFIIYDQDRLYHFNGTSWTTSDRYSHLAKVDFLSEKKELLVVEVTPTMIKKRLPVAFAKKKFGT